MPRLHSEVREIEQKAGSNPWSSTKSLPQAAAMAEQIKAMKVRVESSKLVKPSYEGKPPSTDLCVPLSVFDKINYKVHGAVIYAFGPPTPPNTDIEKGLVTALSEHREWAGRLHEDARGETVILLNDAGARLIEASSDAVLDRAVIHEPSTALLPLHPWVKGVEELLQVQLTRFACGTLVVGFTSHHWVADGHSMSKFIVAWGLATRGLPMDPLPLHGRGAFFIPRNPPRIEFEHRGVEFTAKKAVNTDDDVAQADDIVSTSNKAIDTEDDVAKAEDIVFHKAHFSREFLEMLKAKASLGADRRYNTFESLMAHLWRVVSVARGLDERITSGIRISVNGRARLRPPVPDEFLGNLVLWAFPRVKVGDLVSRPLQFAAALIHQETASINDGYFRSLIDFASLEDVKDEELEGAAEANYRVMSPNLEVHNLARFPFWDLDFGGGKPFMFMPCYVPVEGIMFLVPSPSGDRSMDAYVSLLKHNVASFKQLCHLVRPNL
ncbi:hypothetical protein BHE74_00025203 [Ensete ventricosum]|nr:hypothetical protein BHE74_00025203 [Ensete ventricosum]RZR78488.1 hypothetical protein BHM03_00003858 [Ensete ventricosum]